MRVTTIESSSVIRVLFSLVIFVSIEGLVLASSPNDPVVKPNIILINLDDADSEMFATETLAERFPNLSQLAGRSVKFSNAHATTPLCGPSRACLLRAQYAHHCGICVNAPDLPQSYGFDGGMRTYVNRGYASDDLSTWMQDAGYHTMQVGKFLHDQTVFMIPEGWDDFYSSVGGKYFETHRITNRGGNGPVVETLAPGVYRTNAETADTIGLIQQRAVAQDGKPFFLFLNPFGPHRQQIGSGEMYESKYANLWPNIVPPPSPAYDEADHSDLRGALKHLPRLNNYTQQYIMTHHRERMLAMKSVDDMIGDIVAELEEQNLADNTYIIVTSDNGFVLGHHRVISKGMAVDRATKVPLLVAGPGVIAGNSDHLLAHIDIGPTIVQLAGGTTPSFVDGVSFASLIANPQSNSSVRDTVLIENFETRKYLGQHREFASTGLRTKSEIYVEWATGGREYFDLAEDPHQLQNVFSSLPLSTRQSFASTLRQSRNWAPAEASFRNPYYDLDVLEFPFVLEGIAQTTVATRMVRLSVRDLSNGKFWNGEQWVTGFNQVTANLGQRNGLLTSWKLPLDFGDQKPEGLVKAWVWGLDWSQNYQPPDTVVFRLGVTESEVSLVSPKYAQRFNGSIDLNGLAIAGDDPKLEEVQLRVRNVVTGKFWTGSSFATPIKNLPVQIASGNWSYQATLPAGTYRVSVMGVDDEGDTFDVTHRLFYVD